ncbi:trypsin-like [Protopterus annectens]|uniref:trypsin-like n=1 Tax=Protopterus annectens TaxID=7888 RepID=UPI001CFAE021|nr:trypsin-like [Protopterus annectens]
MTAFIILALHAISLFLAVFSLEDDRIVRSYDCPNNSVPYIASLNIGYHVCAGSLITSQWVVSAALCYQSRLQVRLGEQNTDASEGTVQSINTQRIIRHPGYNSMTLDNNIMLIKLASPAILNAYVQPVSLPSACPVEGTYCLISGWRKPQNTGSNYPIRLQCQDMYVLSDAACHNSFPGQSTANLICIGNIHEGDNSCQGDSGAPAVCSGQLHGITSQTCAENKPGLYTKVCNYKAWIQNAISAN